MLWSLKTKSLTVFFATADAQDFHVELEEEAMRGKQKT